jgi:hypothetical protein
MQYSPDGGRESSNEGDSIPKVSIPKLVITALDDNDDRNIQRHQLNQIIENSSMSDRQSMTSHSRKENSEHRGSLTNRSKRDSSPLGNLIEEARYQRGLIMTPELSNTPL